MEGIAHNALANVHNDHAAIQLFWRISHVVESEGPQACGVRHVDITDDFYILQHNFACEKENEFAKKNTSKIGAE